MHSLDLIPRRWLECEPPGMCHELGTLLTVASIGGTAISAISQLNQADYQADVLRYQAEVAKNKANEEAAAGQRAAITQDRKGELLQSRARAVAASSGTLATSPTQIDLEQQISAQGGYNAMSALYEGMSASRASTDQANIDLFRANSIESAAPLAAFGTVLSGVGGLAKSLQIGKLSGATSGTKLIDLFE
jgi:hypothetical protein